MGNSISLNLNNPKISPKYRASDWRKLNLTATNNQGWRFALLIFLDRINGRYLSPMESVNNNTSFEIREFSGFTIMAIDCLIIETLNQFYNGKDETEGKHWKAFRDFFRQSPFFRDEFDTSRKSEIFYGHFRCGLLHQAQTKRNSIIRYGEPRMVQLVNPADIDEGLIIDRKIFHISLRKEIARYSKKLRTPKEDCDFQLREKFITKMNYIAG